jgi:putative transposase
VLTEHGCKIAPRTFYAWLARAPSARALWDTVITEVLAGYYEPDEHGRRKPESLYGATKMWAHLQRQGIGVARCTVERLMRANGWRGVTRHKKVRTTIADPAAARAADLVKRKFRVPAPNMLLVADLKCRRRHLMSYADPRNMPMTSVMVHSDNAFGVIWSA